MATAGSTTELTRLLAALATAGAGVWTWNVSRATFDWRPPGDETLFALAFDGSLAALRRSAFPEDYDKVLTTLADAQVRRGTFGVKFRVAVPGAASRMLVCAGAFGDDDAGATVMTAAIWHDATPELTLSQRELIALNARLRAAREDDAARLGRELHDGVGQALTALTLDLTWLRERVPAEAREQLDEMAELVKETRASTRRAVAELRPTVIEDLGLVAALESLVEDHRARGHLTITTHLHGGGFAFGRATALAFFRVLEEALANVTRHAGVRDVTVSFEHDGETATLRVEDRGKGFTLDEVRARGALGLRLMRERMETLGGTLTLDAHPGAGTRIVARAPIDEAE